MEGLAIIERSGRNSPRFLLGLACNEGAGMLTLFGNVLILALLQFLVGEVNCPRWRERGVGG